MRKFYNIKEYYKMPFYRKKRIVRKVAKKPYKKRARKQNLVKMIKSVVLKQTEHKMTSQTVAQTFGAVANSSILNVKSIGPSSAYMPIQQNASQDGRVGNKIRTHKVIMRYVLLPLAYNATSNPTPTPLNVIIWIGRVKKYISAPTATDFNSFFQFGSTSFAPTGGLLDITTPINKDYWTVSKKMVHKIGFASANGSGPNATQQYYANNDYSYNVIRSVDITKCFAKTYDFNDASTDPSNSQTYIWMEAVSATGAQFGAAIVPATLNYTIDFVYTDA